MSPQFEALATPHGSAHEGTPAVAARYRDMVAVRHAIEHLEATGVDGDELVLLGDAAIVAEQTPDRRRTDQRFLASTSSAIAAGIVVGAFAGAVVGAMLVGPVVLLWTSLASPGWVFGLMVGWFAAGGCVLGAFFAVERRIGFSESWPLTFENHAERPLWLAVYNPRVDVRGVLQETRPIEVVTDPAFVTSHPDSISRRSA